MVALKLAALLSVVSAIMALPLRSYNQPIERGFPDAILLSRAAAVGLSFEENFDIPNLRSGETVGHPKGVLGR
ncbi:hypothetical protein P691DRAFT_760238 [Macrolepiota fuliginosa MF-IS2]|uniref:Uncharacterized protein n=1 Tax=Macrolepiota fuliginosa MF-IS2 TaxID=1400762 RepID=A0A9P5XBM0_9AGAR|nr:hypothetical protein P691DRAFT_760238 [Macrolepiota fuliginosa MF-IS2]